MTSSTLKSVEYGLRNFKLFIWYVTGSTKSHLPETGPQPHQRINHGLSWSIQKLSEWTLSNDSIIYFHKYFSGHLKASFKISLIVSRGITTEVLLIQDVFGSLEIS